MEKEIICTLEKEGFMGYYFPGIKHTNKAILSVGACSCDEKTCISMADFLIKDGWNVLVLGYYKWKGLSDNLCRIPIDYAEKAIQWLKEEQKIDAIAMTGVSEGASYSLCCAQRLHDISCVIPVVPYDYVMEGIANGTKRLHASTYLYHGKELVYTSMDLLDKGMMYWIKEAKRAKGYGIRRMLRWGYDQIESNLDPDSRIQVENMKADVLLLGVKDDDCWPSDVAVIRMEKLLKNSHYPYRIQAHVYEKASHSLMDGMDSMSAFDLLMLKMMFPSEKKYPKECDQARQDSFKRILAFLEEWK